MALVWLITGTSSGFGSEFAKQALARGDKVIATARNVSKISHLKHLGPVTIALDVTSSQPELDSKAAEAISIYSRVNVLVNNAAYLQFGTLEDMSNSEFATQFNTNVFGAINTTRAFLSHFRSRHSGIIATDALAQEAESFSIKTLLVEPAQFRTELLGFQNSFFVETNIPEYRDITRAAFGMFRDAHGKQRGDPRKGVARIIDVVKGENDAAGRPWPKELALGPDAVAATRKKCEETLRTLEDWEEFSSGTDCAPGVKEIFLNCCTFVWLVNPQMTTFTE